MKETKLTDKEAGFIRSYAAIINEKCSAVTLVKAQTSPLAAPRGHRPRPGHLASLKVIAVKDGKPWAVPMTFGRGTYQTPEPALARAEAGLRLLLSLLTVEVQA